MTNQDRQVRTEKHVGVALGSFSDRIAFCRYVTGVHYELFQVEDGQYGWKGLDSDILQVGNFYSSELFHDVYQATTEVLYCLYRFEGYGDEDACQVIRELSLPQPEMILRQSNYDLTPVDDEVWV